MEEVYILGDLVKIKPSVFDEECDEVFQIVVSSREGIFVLRNVRNNNVAFAVQEEQIKPIPLTPVILEDNGWEKGELKQEENARTYYYPYSKKDCIVELRYYPSCDMFLPYIGQEALMDTLFLYVHQLQHLLFGLGLNSELKV